MQKVLEYARLLELSDDYKKAETKILTFKDRVMKIALTSTSAGTGNFLDDENFEEVEVNGLVPEKASFGVYLDGMTFFKKLIKKKNGTFLVSLNAKYRPIPIGEFSSFKVFGRLSN